MRGLVCLAGLLVACPNNEAQEITLADPPPRQILEESIVEPLVVPKHEETPPAPEEKQPRPLELTGAREGYAEVVLQVKPWAVVYVDDREYGTTPIVLRLTAGAHIIRLVHPQLGTRVETIVVESGVRSFLKVNME